MAVRFDDVDPARDRELVLRFQAGDQSGFEDLYRRYYGRLYRFCLKRMTDPYIAEEVTQESFVRAFRALSNFGGERRFYPWLSVIAARLCIDNYRRSGTVELAHEHVDPGTTDGGVEGVVDEVDRELLRRALARLSQRHRQVLHLREEEGWSYDHIASHLEISMGTVEALLWRARKALRREYLAVVNYDSRMAGLPVLGWLARRLGTMRARVGRIGQHAVPALANASVSITLVVASAAGAGMLTHAPAAAAASPATATRAAVLAGVDQAAAAPGNAATAPAHASTATHAATSTSSANVVRVEHSSTRQQAEENVETPVAGLDANPSAVMSAVSRYVAAVKGES